MRVITGLAKGRKLMTPVGLDVRPTLDRVKEAVFSILYPYLQDAEVLDLFSGSGALGIEALSRGAKRCTFVDSSKKSYDCTINNLKNTGLIEKAEMKLMNAEAFLMQNSRVYDIILLDPPYSKGIEDGVFKIIGSCISKESVIILETEIVPPSYEGFEIIKHARYGRVFVTVYRKTVSD